MNETQSVHWIVVTDLDGTLLNHHDYSFDSAIPVLEKLHEYGIPVVINSSKTRAEIESLRLLMKNQQPFITENGSGILIPKALSDYQPPEAESLGEYWEVILGKPRSAMLASLKSIPKDLKACYKGYHESTVEDVMEMTGLSRGDALASKNRHYTEPLKWLGTAAQKMDFYRELRKRHIHHTEGGRFIHLMGQTNKGSAVLWLSNYYQSVYQKPVKVVALGDAANDIDMLSTADIACVIKSPVNPPPEFDHPHKIMSQAMGDEGWAEVINSIFFNES